MRKYKLIELETGKAIEINPITLNGTNYEMTDREHENLVWETAVDQELVHKDFRHKYRFKYTST